MNQEIINQIERLKYNTKSKVIDAITSKIPILYDLKLHREYSFYTHGLLHSMYKDDSMLFAVGNFPYTPNQKRHSFEDTLLNLVNSQEVKPFLLFLDGKFIKWSDIIVIKDCKYTYIITKKFISDGCKYTTILLPEYNTTYKENVRENLNNTFIFGENGYYYDTIPDTDNLKYTIISVEGNNIYNEKGITKSNKKTELKLDKSKKILYNNFYIFDENGKFIHNPDIMFNGVNVFSFKTKDNIQKDIYYNTFYDLSNSGIIDNSMNVGNKDYLAKTMVDTNSSQKYMQILAKDFDFEFEPTFSYETNINNVLETIMQYNPDLMNEVYKRESNIVIKTYTGKYINKIADKGYVTMSRRISDINDNFVIIFKNGEIYHYYHEIIYKNKDFLFPVIGIKSEDTIEIIFFKNINNTVYNMRFNSDGDDTVLLDPKINPEEMELFTISPRKKEFKTEYSDLLQYKIDYSWKNIGFNKFKMYPIDPYYYDKNLSFVSKRQFKYTYKIIKENETINFDLPDKFKFCNNINKYMVFINGRKISMEKYRITLIKETRPFDDINIYIGIELSKGDIVEIFYIGDDLEEIYNNDKLNLSGNIVLDKSKMKFPFDKDLYMVFVNGRKVLPSSICNIDSTKLQIRDNTNSINNVSIIKYFSDLEVLTDLFIKNKDNLTSIYDKLPTEIINKLFNKDNMTNTENNIYDKSIDMKLILERIIRDYWSRPFINNGDEMVYDFDDSLLDKDENNIIISHAQDANKEDQL